MNVRIPMAFGNQSEHIISELGSYALLKILYDLFNTKSGGGTFVLKLCLELSHLS